MANSVIELQSTRRLPVGAEYGPEHGVHFRVWAPGRKTVTAVFEGKSEIPLSMDQDGYFSALAAEARPGDLYRYRLDDSKMFLPDPASRFQPQGPHGPSQVID